ncbi:MAG: N-acetyltransferase [Hyphomicrobiales bacterium]
MPSAVSVSPATPADAGLMAALHAVCFDRPWDETAMAQFIAGPGTLCLVGFAGEAEPSPAGLLVARRAAEEAELLTLGVVPSSRRLGVGRALLQRAIDQLRASGASNLFLEVADGNEAALELYRALGARPVGRRPSYYESGADATIFSLALSDSGSDDGQIAG